MLNKIKQQLTKLKSNLDEKKKGTIQNTNPLFLKTNYYQDLINPYHMIFHPSYLETEETLYDFRILNDMSGNKKANYLLNILKHPRQTDLSLFFSPIDSKKTLDDYKKIVRSLEMKIQKDEEEGKEIDKKMVKMITDYKEIIDDLEEGNESYLNYSIIYNQEIEKKHDSKTNLENFLEERNVNSKLFRTKIQQPSKFYIPYGQIEEAYVSRLPLCEYRIKDWSNISASAGITLFPFFTETKTPGVKDGVPYGINRNTGELMFFNHSQLYEDKEIMNKNMNIFGGTGSGKTTFLRTQIPLRIAYGDHFIIFDPKRDYSSFSKDMGGQTISFKIDKPIGYNIFYRNTGNYTKKNGEKEEIQSVETKKMNLINIFGIMVPYLNEKTDIAEFSKNILDSALSKVYIKDPSGENTSLQIFFDEYLVEATNYFIKQESTKINSFTQASERLKVNLGNFVKKKDGTKGRYYKMFLPVSKENEIKLEDNPLITFDLFDLFQDDMIFTVACLIGMEFSWNQITKKQWAGTGKSIYIAMDENWKLLNYEEAGAYEERFSRLIRGLGGGLYTLSHSLKEYTDTKHGRVLLSQAGVSIYLKLDESEFAKLQDFFPKRFTDDIIEDFKEIGKSKSSHGQGYLYLKERMQPFKYLYLPSINGRDSWQEKKTWQENADKIEGYEIK